MSNNCINKIILPNLTNRELELLREKVISKDEFNDEYFDFNKVIKRPENMLLRDFRGKTLNSFSKYYYENPDDLSQEELDSIIRDNVVNVKIRNEIVNIQDYVEDLYSTKELKEYLGKELILWYDWCRANWGTKWNSIWTTLEKDQLVFSTAWDPISANFFSQFIVICREILGERANRIALYYDEYRCKLHGKYYVNQNKEVVHKRKEDEEVA